MEIPVRLRYLVPLILACFSAHAGDFATRYSAKLSELDKKHSASVCVARDTLRDWLPQATIPDRAAMFRAFLDFTGETARKSFDDFSSAVTMPIYEKASSLLKARGWKIGQSMASLLRSDPDIHRAIGPWLDCGFGVYMSEGIFYIGADITAIEPFVPLLPSDLKAWVNFIQHEGGFSDPVADDGLILLSWRELADRLHRWEDFLRTHPTLIAEVGPEIHQMALFLLRGLDNSPIRLSQSDQLDPEVLAAWRRFASSPNPSRYTPTMRRLLALLDANGGRLTPEAEALTNWVVEEREADIRAIPKDQ
jgi:hypothetical protein